MLRKPTKLLVTVERADKATLERTARKRKMSVAALVREYAQQLRDAENEKEKSNDATSTER